MKPKSYNTETISIDKLQPHPRNYREHPDDQLNHIITSIEQHGIYRNIVVASDYTVLAGHGVMKACRKMGLKEVPVIKLDIDSNSSQALKLLAGDNETGRLAQVNDRLLSEILKEVKDFDAVGLVGTGFDEMMLANLVMISRTSKEISSINEAAEWVGMPDYEPKDDGIRLSVNFMTEDDRELFFKVIGQKFTEKTKAIWFPYKERNDMASIKYEVD
jgi:hypothetical protein